MPIENAAEINKLITLFNQWRSGKLVLANSDVYNHNFVARISSSVWAKLAKKLKLEDNEKQSVFSSEILLLLSY
jgi:hypothetical protein